MRSVGLRSLGFGPWAVCLLTSLAHAATPGAPAPGEPVAFAALPGFADDDLPSALETFRASCRASARKAKPLRAAVPAPPYLRAACAALPPGPTAGATARAFFERHFAPRRIAAAAFFTGYYEPVVAGSLAPTPGISTPLRGAPADLVSVAPGRTPPGLDPTLTSARRLPDGRLAALPDRAAIEGGSLAAAAPPLAYVASPVDAFFIQVQGSARIRLPDGKLRRLVYAGRNGYPYASIGKLLVQRLNIPPAEMGMAQLRAWIEANGQRPGEAGARLMQENRSYIFFRFDEMLAADAGPIGGEGISLTALRSLAIDRKIWPYGLPFLVDTTLPDATPFRRLMVAQDTGSAIVGATRADIFFGSGDEAARSAGPMRQPGTLYVLWPKSATDKGSLPTSGAAR